MEKNKEKTGEHKVLLGKDNIIYVEMSGDLGRENTLGTINDALPLMRTDPGKAKILAVVNSSLVLGTSLWRKELVGIFKKLYVDPGFEKVAVYGVGPLVKTIISFILGATGIRNMKLFDTKEKAIKWLKED